MDANSSSSPDARIVPIHGPLPLPPQAHEVLVDVEEMMNMADERFKTQVLLKPTRIHRFPHNLRGIGGADGRYVVPSVVAIGPYHHGLPHLQEMEKVKHAAALQFCRDAGRSAKEVYEKIFSIAGDTRSCYTATDGTSLLAPCLRDAEFAAMLFLDGCFLLQLMTKGYEPPIAGRILSSSASIYKDIFLLENQIPWQVLEALMEFWGLVDEGLSSKKTPEYVVRDWIVSILTTSFFGRKLGMPFRKFLQIFLMNCRRMRQEEKDTPSQEKEETDTADESSTNNGDSKPPHLLGLLRFIVIRGMPSQKRKGQYTSLSMSTSGRGFSHLKDMNIQKKTCFGELTLPPLFLNDVVACGLVNLAALEAAEAINASSLDSDGYVVSSYLSVMTMLMDREEDVHELRGKGVLCSRLSNAETLAFFKGLGKHLRQGYNYHAILQEIEEYMRKRPVRILVHKFVYNNYKLIAAVLSIASVLVGIFKALYSLKQS
ncbi:hypothetical protein ACP70R_002841 [Stipagrostis hirtigluma subsp. patula]